MLIDPKQDIFLWPLNRGPMEPCFDSSALRVIRIRQVSGYYQDYNHLHGDCL